MKLTYFLAMQIISASGNQSDILEKQISKNKSNIRKRSPFLTSFTDEEIREVFKPKSKAQIESKVSKNQLDDRKNLYNFSKKSNVIKKGHITGNKEFDSRSRGRYVLFESKDDSKKFTASETIERVARKLFGFILEDRNLQVLLKNSPENEKQKLEMNHKKFVKNITSLIQENVQSKLITKVLMTPFLIEDLALYSHKLIDHLCHHPDIQRNIKTSEVAKIWEDVKNTIDVKYDSNTNSKITQVFKQEEYLKIIDVVKSINSETERAETYGKTINNKFKLNVTNAGLAALGITASINGIGFNDQKNNLSNKNVTSKNNLITSEGSQKFIYETLKSTTNDFSGVTENAQLTNKGSISGLKLFENATESSFASSSTFTNKKNDKKSSEKHYHGRMNAPLIKTKILDTAIEPSAPLAPSDPIILYEPIMPSAPELPSGGIVAPGIGVGGTGIGLLESAVIGGEIVSKFNAVIEKISKRKINSIDKEKWNEEEIREIDEIEPLDDKMKMTEKVKRPKEIFKRPKEIFKRPNEKIKDVDKIEPKAKFPNKIKEKVKDDLETQKYKVKDTFEMPSEKVEMPKDRVNPPKVKMKKPKDTFEMPLEKVEMPKDRVNPPKVKMKKPKDTLETHNDKENNDFKISEDTLENPKDNPESFNDKFKEPFELSKDKMETLEDNPNTLEDKLEAPEDKLEAPEDKLIEHVENANEIQNVKNIKELKDFKNPKSSRDKIGKNKDSGKKVFKSKNPKNTNNNRIRNVMGLIFAIIGVIFAILGFFSKIYCLILPFCAGKSTESEKNEDSDDEFLEVEIGPITTADELEFLNTVRVEK